MSQISGKMENTMPFFGTRIAISANFMHFLRKRFHESSKKIGIVERDKLRPSNALMAYIHFFFSIYLRSLLNLNIHKISGFS